MDSAIAMIIILGITTIIVSALIAVLWTGLVMSGHVVGESAQLAAGYLSSSTINSKMFVSYDDIKSTYWPPSMSGVALNNRTFDIASLRQSTAPKYSAAAAYVFLQENVNDIDTFYCNSCRQEFSGGEMGLCLFGHTTTTFVNEGFLLFTSEPVAILDGSTGLYNLVAGGYMPPTVSPGGGYYASWIQ